MLTDMPELVLQWHPTKNIGLIMENITAHSGKKIWWQCQKVKEHEWETTVDARTSRTNLSQCPYCDNQKVCKSNCLETIYPEISKQWHPIKNGNLKPSDVLPGSKKKVWWKCNEGSDHEWITSVANRKYNGCPFCSRQKLSKSNSLAFVSPDLAKEWDVIKNDKLTPFNISAKSNNKVWWRCTKNSDHVWESTPTKRVKCPYCSGRKLSKSSCLSSTHPELSKEWHPTKNGNLTPSDIVAKSNTKVWWKCPVSEDHEWEASIVNRTLLNRGCPCCAGRKVVKSNCLATTNSELSKEWNFAKNILTPENITAGSIKKVWWKCSKNHEWLATPNNRTSLNRGCPVCRESKGEKIISAILGNMKINFTRQHRFATCKNIVGLPFDFVFDFNNKKAAIEYQGKQHYIPHSFGSKSANSHSNLCEVKKRDNIKKKWCKNNNNVILLIIPYWKLDKIENEINKFLKRL